MNKHKIYEHEVLRIYVLQLSWRVLKHGAISMGISSKPEVIVMQVLDLKPTITFNE